MYSIHWSVNVFTDILRWCEGDMLEVYTVTWRWKFPQSTMDAHVLHLTLLAYCLN